MRRSPADSTNRSLAAFGKLQHIPRRSSYNLSRNGTNVTVYLRVSTEGGSLRRQRCRTNEEPEHHMMPELEKLPATSYSPTQLPMQYHRRKRA